MPQVNSRSHTLIYSGWHRVKDWGEENISTWQWSVSAEFNSLSSKNYLVLAYWPASTPQHLPWNREAKLTNPPSHHFQGHSSFPSFLLNFLSLYFTHTQISRCVPFSFIDYFSIEHIFLVWRSSPNGLESDFKVSFFFTTLPIFFYFNQDLYHLEDKICPEILKMSFLRNEMANWIPRLSSNWPIY